MSEISTNGVVGSDGVVPIYNPNEGWRQFAMHEVFFPGGTGSGKYVPKVKDYVKDVDNNTDYICDKLDPVTLYPTLRQINPNNTNFNISDVDRIFGSGNSAAPDTRRLYLNHASVPGVAYVDIRTRVPGTEARYARLVRVQNGVEKVISARYDNSKNFIDDKILLETVAMENEGVENYAVRTVPGFYTNEHMPDDEVVILYIYSEKDVVINKRQLLVTNTTFVRNASQGLKYITNVSIESGFLSKSNPSLLEYPLNLPLSAMNMTGIVHYSDGTTMELPVDGNKFSMDGLEEYLSTIPGEEVYPILRYRMSANEQAIDNTDVNNRVVQQGYTLRTIESDNSYSVKLFGFPVWVDASSGYRMEFWLYNLDRNVVYNVTPYVKFTESTGTFNPKGYGYLQRRLLQLNLRDVSASFKPFIHTQQMDIELLSTPMDGTYPWRVSHVTDSSRPAYGISLYARRVTPHEISISSGFTAKADWLTNLLGRSYPLYDKTRELSYPEPTHVILEYSNRQVTIDVNDWNKTITMIEQIPIYQSIRLKFVKSLSTGGWMHIAMAQLVVKP